MKKTLSEVFMQATDFNIKISSVPIAHQFTLYKDGKCDYSKGRTSYGLILILNGSLQYTFTNGESFAAKSGDLLLFKPTTGYVIRVHEPCTHYTVNFQVEGTAEEIDAFETQFEEHTFLAVEASPFSYFEQLFEDCSKSFFYKSWGYLLKLHSTLLQILYDFFKRKRKEENVHEYNPVIQPAVSYIDEHWSEKISLEELAEKCHLSLTHFRRLFLQSTGKTPAQYKAHLLLRYASALLQSSDYSVKEIAYLCGFDDPNYFSRFFKKHTGVSPLAY